MKNYIIFQTKKKRITLFWICSEIKHKAIKLHIINFKTSICLIIHDRGGFIRSVFVPLIAHTINTPQTRAFLDYIPKAALAIVSAISENVEILDSILEFKSAKEECVFHNIGSELK